MSVSINPPKTPVTTGSKGMAVASLPNVCKMPGPPAPFVPVPLPNIGKSGDSPKGYSTSVEIEGCKVGIKGATFNSMGDMASKGTGGGIVSSNTHGPTSFVGPGAMNVKIEGKNVQLLSDPMLNNNGPSGSPANSATMLGLVQGPGVVYVVGDEVCPRCSKTHGDQGKLAERKDTQGLAGQLVTGFKANKGEKRVMTMLAAVVCFDEAQHYGANSGQQSHQKIWAKLGGFHAPMSSAPETEDGRKARYRRAIGGSAQAFELAWGRAQGKVKKYNLQPSRKKNADPKKLVRKSKNPAYPPGVCAGPRAVVLALEHGGWPIGLTERYLDTKESTAGALARYRERLDDKDGQRGVFSGEQAVPPCESCQIVLPMLICPDDRKTVCEHRSPSGGTCTQC